MGYFHSALGWKRSAPAQPTYPRGAGLAAAGRVATGGCGVPLPPGLNPSPALGSEKAMAGLGNAACPSWVPVRSGTSRVLRPPQQHPQPGQGWRMLRPHGGVGDTHAAPGQTLKCSFAKVRGCLRSACLHPCLHPLPAPAACTSPRAGREAALKGDPVQTQHPRRTGGSGKALLLPPRIYRKSLH